MCIYSKHFREYANLCFERFGDRVKHWITLNEPYAYSNMGYAIGTFAPGRCSDWQQLNCTGGNSAIEPYLVTHNLLLAHANAVDLYKTTYQVRLIITFWLEYWVLRKLILCISRYTKIVPYVFGSKSTKS